MIKNYLQLIFLSGFLNAIPAVLLAQNAAEQKRAAAWLNLPGLQFKQSYAASYLTADEQKALDAAGNGSVLAYCGTTLQCALNVPLPVKDLQLTGERMNEEKVNLKWETTWEQNNTGFVLERLFANSQQVYDSVAFIRGVGNSQVKTKYGYADANSFPGKTLYRLRQVDADGGFKFSNTIIVDGYSSAFSVSVVPNPTVTDNISVVFRGGLKSSEKACISVVNSSGIVLYRDENVRLFNSNRYTLKNISLPAGVYWIKAKTGIETRSATFVITK